MSAVIKEERVQSGKSPTYLIHIQNTLLNLNDFVGLNKDGTTRYVSMDDLKDVFVGILNFGTVDDFIVREIVEQSDSISSSAKAASKLMSTEKLLGRVAKKLAESLGEGREKVQLSRETPLAEFTEPLVFTS